METYEYKYQAAAAADVVVSTGPAILKRIIVGKDVAASVIEVSDHASDGNGNVQIYIANDNIGSKWGVIEVDAIFKVGICADLTNQTNVTFVWTPLGTKG